MKDFGYSIGYQFNYFTVTGPQYYLGKEIYITCTCICGVTKELRARDIGKSNRQSCGCKQKELVSISNRRGTLAYQGRKICSMCKQEKDVSAFKFSGYTRDKLKQFCSRCAKDIQLKEKYGIGIDEYERLFALQGGRCACCGSDKPKTPRSADGHFVVDHCHKTKKVRGLLCFNCNTAIGKLGDNSSDVLRAYHYLKMFEDSLTAE